HDVQIGARRNNRALDLGAVAHDPGVRHQRRDLLGAIAGNQLWLEAIKSAAEILTLAQNSDPRQPSLKAVENQLLIERLVVKLRNTPLLVVIGDIDRIPFRPRAPGQPILSLERTHTLTPPPSGCPALRTAPKRV